MDELIQTSIQDKKKIQQELDKMENQDYVSIRDSVNAARQAHGLEKLPSLHEEMEKSTSEYVLTTFNV